MVTNQKKTKTEKVEKNKRPLTKEDVKHGKVKSHKESWNEVRNDQLFLWLLNELDLTEMTWITQRTWKGVDRQPYKVLEKDLGSHHETGLPIRKPENIAINSGGNVCRDGLPLSPVDYWMFAVCLSKKGKENGANTVEHMARCVFRNAKTLSKTIDKLCQGRKGLGLFDVLSSFKRICDERKKRYEDNGRKKLRRQFEKLQEESK